MVRRDFLKSSSLAAAATLIPGALGRVLAGEADALRALRGGAGIFTGGRGGTIGWWIGADGALVIDTQFPETARTCLSAVRTRTARKLDAVLITHHHADHTSGIPAFRGDAAKVVAHRNVPGLQKAAAEQRGTLEEQDYPDTLFDVEWASQIGTEPVRGRHPGAAHTAGDAIWHLEKANVVHMGDLVFHKMVPFIDRPGGASIEGWIAVLEKAVKDYPKDAIYLYGHASEGNDVVGGRDGLPMMRDYLSGLLDYVKKGKAAGTPLEALQKVDRVPGFPDHVGAWDGAVAMNVAAAWEELGG
jgi:glyoxylase-like metal-dependent hydrolase (beta-lactamase superfamily II)